MSDFAPSTAVITGAGSGIGRAIAAKLSAEGVQVLLADLPGEALEHATAALDQADAQACDVSDLAQVEALADAAFDRLGHVDLLINNAGVGGPTGAMWEVDPTEARAHFDVNFWGVWNGCRAFAPRMIAQDTPSAMYNTGSENSLFCAVRGSAAYIAAKHGVLGLTESLRDDLPDHIHAGTIIPGWVFTPLGPEQFMKFGMDVDEYIGIIMPQILARRRFVVSHGYNDVRIAERMDELAQSYQRYAPRSDGDEMHDVKTVLANLQRGRS